MKIQVLAWGMHNNVAGLNRIIGYQPFPFFSMKGLKTPSEAVNRRTYNKMGHQWLCRYS